jgi:glutaredoxin
MRAKRFFGELRVPYVNIDIEQNPEDMAYVEKVNNGMRIIPSIVFLDGSILAEPSIAELARACLQTHKRLGIMPRHEPRRLDE